MFEIKGKYNIAKVMLPGYEYLDQATYSQILEVVNSSAFVGGAISIMPDCHKGMDKGSPVGFTMPIGEYVIPSVVGVDLACGMSCTNLGNIHIDLKKLDEFLRKNIPLGFNLHKHSININNNTLKETFEELGKKVLCDRVMTSLKTTGGGNHFFECDQAENGDKILVIHTGSRNLGKQTCDYHQAKAVALTKQSKQLNGFSGLKTGSKEAEEYLHDVEICREYACLNRRLIIEEVVNNFFNQDLNNYVECLHNYIDTNNIVRKGAIYAGEGASVIIPLNMRDGIIFGKGKSTKEWNYSAPHGAGRIGSRSDAKKRLNVEEFKNEMIGIYTTSVGQNTIDEAPGAYKDSSMIINLVKEVVDIEYIAKPIYNLKA